MQNRVIDLRSVNRQLRGDGEPPDNGGMEHRIAKLESLAEKTGERFFAIENRLTRIDAKQDDFAKHYATKEDLALLKADMFKAMNDQTWKIIGAMITFGTLLSGIVFYVARNVR